jgi:hypothetical protein
VQLAAAAAQLARLLVALAGAAAHLTLLVLLLVIMGMVVWALI